MTTAVAQEEELDASLYPIAVLLDELKHEDIQLRLNATRRIKTIADALGPERTRGELLPFITETVDDEDEVLLTLAEELGDFLEEVGGPPYSAVLVQPLETLANAEETVVREKAVESLCNLSNQVQLQSEDDARSLHVDHLFPLAQRLANGDWFTSRMSACSLFADLYSRIPDDHTDLRTEILDLYKCLVHDSTPMVRRAAASNIGNFATAVYQHSPTLVCEQLLPLFADLVEDDQDSVRLIIVENAPVFAALLNPIDTLEVADTSMSSESQEPNGFASSNTPLNCNPDRQADSSDARPNAAERPSNLPSAPTGNGPLSHHRTATERIIDMVRGFSADKSWRVRYMVATRLNDLCDALGPEATRTDLLHAYMTVLQDNEPEVRTAAAFKVADIVKKLVALPPKPGSSSGSDHVIYDIFPNVAQLVTDSSQHVRAALASNIMGLAPVLGVEVTVSHLVEIVLSLLKDEYPEVRLNVITHLDKVSFIMSIEKLSSELLPAIVDLAEDKNWRVRLAIIERIPLLARQLGKDFFEENNKLGDLCISWLGDCVFSIREAAIKNLRALTEIFGLEWAKKYIVPQVTDMYDESGNYLLRMTALHAIGILSEVLGPETVEESFLPIVTERASRDPVPNVRFCSAKTLNRVIPYVREDVRESKIRPCLMTLVDSSEKDQDVNYFAQQALLKLSSCPT
ncbi:Serine/threonine-protein phosphatase 2A 65 kDa regulatory subunit A beta isoform [Gracilariopsis chorda]|uniref:Serine/threonine-protein phosphatase 2A 65 kDa regulatory subunit A beta isoform n=1 Tax=Gracilariopsis chorda TaxID=448386 RepID=A0A2V3IQZ5_9FLOR|nr:Serine/threonine-protein phosphatase 2A 65 kDa regulatory subunit A beta isoform [Gracilariopsis chorda]|eukprot:PXF44536.1 Serine/threonine-protein phosphatase 2A 65 kDa regulatory subunit A beta isoform [Gracilariopsis chorda]